MGLFRVCWAVMDLFLRRIDWDCSGYVGHWWTSFHTGLHGIVLVMYIVMDLCSHSRCWVALGTSCSDGALSVQ